MYAVAEPYRVLMQLGVGFSLLIPPGENHALGGGGHISQKREEPVEVPLNAACREEVSLADASGTFPNSSPGRTLAPCLAHHVSKYSLTVTHLTRSAPVLIIWEQGVHRKISKQCGNDLFPCGISWPLNSLRPRGGSSCPLPGSWAPKTAPLSQAQC